MEKTYQPWIIKKADEILHELSKEISIYPKSSEYLYNLLTQKFIDGKISEGDVAVFDSDEELDMLVSFCKAQEDLENLQDLGYIDSFDDNESFFLTEKGKKYAEENLIGKKN